MTSAIYDNNCVNPGNAELFSKHNVEWFIPCADIRDKLCRYL